MSSFLENSKNSPYDPKSNYKLGLNKKRDQQIWAIAGGKGGVGKSLVTANVSICLALMGYKVSSVDLDLGGANLHTCLGVPIPEKTLSDYLSKKVRNFSDLLNETPIENLSLISGAQDDLGIANLRHMQKTRLISKLRDIDSDYVLMDLGAGTSFNTLDFFINSEASSSAVPPISPIITIDLVSLSLRNNSRQSIKLVPFIGSPPIPIHVD